MICHPVGELAVEGLCLRKPDPVMTGGVLERVFHRPQKAGVIEDGIVISNVTVQSNVMRSYWNLQLPISLIQ